MRRARSAGRSSAPYETSFASGAALVVRREAWQAADGFEAEYFMYGEDLDLALRLRLLGWGVGVVPAARVEHDYAFVKGDYKWFHLERNRWWTLLGDYPTPLLALLLPALLVFDVALLAVAARGGWAAGEAARAAGRAAHAAVGAAPARAGAGRAPRLDGRVRARADRRRWTRRTSARRARPLLAVQASYWRGVRGLLGGAGG